MFRDGPGRLAADPDLAITNRSDRSEITNGVPDVMGEEKRKSERGGTTTGRGRDPHAGRPAPSAASTVGVRDDEEAAAAAPPADDPQRSEEHHKLSIGTTSATDATNPTETAPEALSLDDLEFHALRAIRYHEDRGSFLDLMRRALDFLVVALGAGAVTSLFAESTAWAATLNVITALIGALQLVANLGDKAQEHRWARKKFCELLARVTEAKLDDAVTPRTMRKLTKRWTEIWGDEPTTMYVLEAVAFNATVRALNRDVNPDDLIGITWWQSITRNWLTHQGFENLTRGEKRAAAKAGQTG